MKTNTKQVRGLAAAVNAAAAPLHNYIAQNTQLRFGEPPVVIAHRGFDSSYPQNTILAYSCAIAAGADAIELDVSYSSDGVGYCFHDDTVDSLTTGAGNFVQLTAATIDGLRFKALAGSDFSDEPVPLFTEALALGRETGTQMYCELKQISDPSQVALFIQQIVNAGMTSLVSANSGNFPMLQSFRALNADINLGYIAGGGDYHTWVDQAASLGNATVICVHDTVFASPDMVAYCAKRGVDLAVYTIPDSYYLNRVARLGVTKFMCGRFARGSR